MPTCIRCTLFKSMHRIVIFFADAPSLDTQCIVINHRKHCDQRPVSSAGVRLTWSCGSCSPVQVLLQLWGNSHMGSACYTASPVAMATHLPRGGAY